MAVVLQKIYIIILNLSFSLVSKIISEETRNNINKGCIFLLILLTYYGEVKDLMKVEPLTNLCLLQAILLIIITIMSMTGPLHLIKWKSYFIFCWYLFCMLALAARLFHTTGAGFVALPFMMLFLFPALFLVWNNRGDYVVLFDMVAKFSVIIGVAIFVMSIFYNPLSLEMVRYTGITGNPGSLAKVGLAAITCGFYLLFRTGNGYWGYAIFCGMEFSLVFLSGSRMALITVIIEIILFISFYLKDRIVMNSYKKSLSCRRICIIIVLVFITIPVTSYLLTNGYTLLYGIDQGQQNNIAHHSFFPIGQKVFASEEKLKSSKESSSEHKEDPRLKYMEERSKIGDKDLDQISSGRITLYKAAISKLNLIGNDMKEPIYTGVGYIHTVAHNTALEYAYRFGIPAGLLFLILEIVTAIYVFSLLFRKKHCESYHYFLIFAIVGFGMMSLTDVVYNPAANPGMLYYFLALIPFIRKSRRVK